MIKKIPLSRLILDFTVYPRHTFGESKNAIDSTHVKNLVDAILVGEILPPLVANAKDYRISDGFNRLTAYKKIFKDDEDHPVEVELKNYKNDSEMFLDSIRLNSHHGKPLEQKDKAYISIRASEFGIDMAIVARALNVGLEPYLEFISQRTAITMSGEKIPLAYGARSLSKLPKMTNIQQEKFAKGQCALKPEKHAQLLLTALKSKYNFNFTRLFLKTLEDLKKEIEKILNNFPEE